MDDKEHDVVVDSTSNNNLLIQYDDINKVYSNSDQSFYSGGGDNWKYHMSGSNYGDNSDGDALWDEYRDS